MTGTFTAIDGTQYTVTVGTAAGTLTLAADPVHISWSRADYLYAPIRTIEASIIVLTSTDLCSLYSDSPLGTSVTITKGEDAEVVFFGYLTPQVWDAPDTGVNDEVEMIAVDALTALKTVPYVAASTNSPIMLSAEDILTRACRMVGITFDSRDFPKYDKRIFNEMAMLPEDHSASFHSSERKKWIDIITGIGIYFRVTFMVQGNTLVFADIDDMLNSHYDNIVFKGTDRRMSIEPARSHIKVKYEYSEQIDLGIKINEERLGKSIVKTTRCDSNRSVNNSHSTVTEYVESKDWEPTDGRQVCGAIIYDMPGTLSSSTSEQYAVVGPAHLKASARKMICSHIDDEHERYVKVKYSGYYRDDQTKDGGYHILKVFSYPGNKGYNYLNGFYFYPLEGGGEFYVDNNTDGRTRVDKLFAPPDELGISTVEIKEYNYYCYFHINDVYADGVPFDIAIPDGFVLTDISIIPKSYIYTGSQFVNTDIDDERDYIISEDYNSELSISSLFRPNYECYSIGDVPDKATWDKFPHVNPQQYAAPRRRTKMTIEPLNGMSPFSAVGYKGHSCIIDEADIDLRNVRANVELLETYKTI